MTNEKKKSLFAGVVVGASFRKECVAPKKKNKIINIALSCI